MEGLHSSQEATGLLPESPTFRPGGGWASGLVGLPMSPPCVRAAVLPDGATHAHLNARGCMEIAHTRASRASSQLSVGRACPLTHSESPSSTRQLGTPACEC